MESYLDYKKIKYFKRFAHVMAWVVLIFVIINFFIDLSAGNEFWYQLLYLVQNIYFVIIACILVGLHSDKVSDKWKYFLAILMIVYTFITFYNSVFFFGPESHWTLTYCKFSTIGYIQTIWCTIESICIVLKKYLKLVDALAIADFLVGFIGILICVHQGDLTASAHYVIFHMLWGLMCMFVYPEEGYTDVLCSDSILSRSFSLLMLVMGVSAVILALSQYFAESTGIFGSLTSYYDSFTLAILFIVMWLFTLIIARRLNHEDYAKRLELDKSYRINENLLSEIHHRVKNNLGVILSFLNIQKRKINDEDAVNIIGNVQNRVMAMSLVHSSLYESKDFSEVDFKNYIENLTKYVAQTYDNDKISFDIDIPEGIILNIDIITPLGLMVNESIVNSFKYAFPNNAEGKVFIHLKDLGDDSYELIVGDNGIGCSMDDLESSNGIGYTIIRLLISQIDGEVEYTFDDGLKRTIKFENKKL